MWDRASRSQVRQQDGVWEGKRFQLHRKRLSYPDGPNYDALEG